jgi:transcription antitermination protein NusB
MNKYLIPNMGIIQMGIRRQSREVAVQALYMFEFHSPWSESKISELFENYKIPETCHAFSDSLIRGALVELESIDRIISESSSNWPLARMARVDRAILRVAVFELFYLGDIPHNVTINEAIEIAKRFSSDDAPMFINGVLDRIAKTHVFSDKFNVKDIDDKKSRIDRNNTEENESVPSKAAG